MQRNALRALDYGPAIKIAILFKSNWWTTKLGIVGGQSFTDLPIRTIVYPSYGVDSDTPSKVLIASYAWTTDAYRLSALASKKSKLGEKELEEIKKIQNGQELEEFKKRKALEELEELKELVLRNLAEVHSCRDDTITYNYLKGEFVDIHVKDWNNDEYSMGAFPFFSPGQFGELYKSLNYPAAGKRLHFAGEALSTRHAWVTGALDSAWRAVYEYLEVTKQDDKKESLKKIWGVNTEWSGGSSMARPPLQKAEQKPQA